MVIPANHQCAGVDLIQFGTGQVKRTVFVRPTQRHSAVGAVGVDDRSGTCARADRTPQFQAVSDQLDLAGATADVADKTAAVDIDAGR